LVDLDRANMHNAADAVRLQREHNGTGRSLLQAKKGNAFLAPDLDIYAIRVLCFFFISSKGHVADDLNSESFFGL
jgi:hypothetical protein